MKLSLERTRWAYAVTLGVAVRWEDWHLRQVYLDIVFIVWSWRLVLDLAPVP